MIKKVLITVTEHKLFDNCVARRCQIFSGTSRLAGRRYQRTFDLSRMILCENLPSSCRRSASDGMLHAQRALLYGILPKITPEDHKAELLQVVSSVVVLS